MTQDKDKIQRAADALEALRTAPIPDGPVQEPASEVPVQPAASNAPAEPTVPAAPAKPTPPGPPPVPSDPGVITVVVRHSQKVRLFRRGSAGRTAGEAHRVQPAPPKLPPLARAHLNRQIALRRTLIPILLTTGLAMIALGVWSVAVLAGGSDPLRGEGTFRTRYLARLMLLAWPIAAILLAGTAYLMHEVYTHYRTYQSPSEANQKRH